LNYALELVTSKLSISRRDWQSLWNIYPDDWFRSGYNFATYTF